MPRTSQILHRKETTSNVKFKSLIISQCEMYEYKYYMYLIFLILKFLIDLLKLLRCYEVSYAYLINIHMMHIFNGLFI